MEHKDATEEEKKINESNAGCYWFMGDKLLYALDRITNQNAQNEYYLTDSLSILLGAGNGANAYVVENSDVVLGANDRAQLHILNEILRHKIMHQWMIDGVDIPCTDGVMIADTVQIGTGTTILPGTILLGNTTIGKDCLIGPNTYIMDGTVGNGVTLDNVKLTDSGGRRGRRPLCTNSGRQRAAHRCAHRRLCGSEEQYRRRRHQKRPPDLHWRQRCGCRGELWLRHGNGQL